MNVLLHLKSCCSFWKPSVARKVTLYFTIFGLLIFYLTSVAYLFAGKKHLVAMATRLVHSQLSRIPDSDYPDFWRQSVGQKQPALRELAELLTSLPSGVHTLSDVSIYSRTTPGAPWQRMRLDYWDVLRIAPVDDPLIAKLENRQRGPFVQSNLDFFMTHRKMAIFVNITGAADRGEYYFKIDIARQGAAYLMGSRLVSFVGLSLLVLLMVRILGYVFARRLAAPVEILSATAARVAEGDLSVEVPPMGNNEIGILGQNFNRMIYGLRDWQRIKTMELELEKGRQIQQEFLPQEIPHLPDWNIATCFFPAREVSGDFYDVFDLPGGLLGLAIADVCDKGVGSALYMALIRSLIRVYAEQTLDGLRTKSSTPHPQDRALENLQAPGDLLLGLTDGVTEARSPNDELFTRQRVKDLLSQPVSSSNDLLERIRSQLFTFIGQAPRLDDVTMLAVQRAT